MLRRDGALAEADWPDALRSRRRAAAVQAAARWCRRACPTRRSGSCKRSMRSCPAALWPPAGGSWPVRGAIQTSGAVQTHRAGRPRRLERAARPGAVDPSRRPVAAPAWSCLAPTTACGADTTHRLPLERMADPDRSRCSGTRRTGEPRPTSAEAAAAACAAPSRRRCWCTRTSLADADLAAFEAFAEALAIDPRRAWSVRRCSAPTAAAPRTLAPVDRRAATVQELGSAVGAAAAGRRAWAELDTGSARVVLATSRPVPDDARVDVVLPMAHPYERQASITNLEGRVQQQDGGAAPPPRRPRATGASCAGSGAPRSAIARCRDDLLAHPRGAAGTAPR